MTEPVAFALEGYSIRDRVRQGREVSVYQAVRSHDGLRLAAKVPNSLHPAPEVIRRLRHEFEILRRLDHPNVCRAHALVPSGSGCVLFSEWYDGRTLARGGDRQPFTTAAFLDAAVQMVEAVAHTHDSGVIHGDLSPSNFVLENDHGRVTLIDFGLATASQNETADAIGAAALGGTLAYISPEQTGRTGHRLDYRSDYYSLGATFYEMLTGRPPFSAPDRMALIHQHLATAPIRPSDVGPDVPGVLSDIVLKLLAKSPDDRYQSSAGLLADLERCRSTVLPGGSIEPFEIAERDHSSVFHVPQRLYGREPEVQALIDAFHRTVDAGAPSMVLVAGEPGVGKTSLVREVQTPIVERSGRFVGAKFDQFRRNVPFATLIEALRDLVRQVLAEPDEVVLHYKDRLVGALGANGQLVIDVIPELERITGPFETTADLAPAESRNRFQQVFRSFIATFAEPEHPLVIHLDDVQWIDSSTLRWVEASMLDRSLGPLMMICTYRDNEVTASHPFAVAIDRLSGEGVAADTIEIAPLPASTVAEIVGDTLWRDTADVAPLAELLHEKTLGNPFFLHQLLDSLHTEGSIQFASESGAWEYDLESIRNAGITDNVVEYMQGRLARFAPASQDVLRIAACIGNTFDLDMLSVAAESTRDDVQRDLAAPLEQGLVVRLGPESDIDLVRYRFQHDRVQQAAYRMWDEQGAQAIRLRIGRRILADCDDAAHDDRLFDLLGHLNVAHELITDRDERTRIATLNVAAAARARMSTAYDPALSFVRSGMMIAPGDVSQRLLFDLALERAECEHLNGDQEAAERYFDEALGAAADENERCEVYERKIHFYTNQAKFQRAYETGLEAAKMLGIWLPPRFIPPLLIWDHLNILRITRGRRPQDLADLPELDDDRLRLALRFMGAVAKAAYQIRPELCVSICARIVLLSLRNGYTPETAIGYLAYGVIFRGGVRGDHTAGDEFGQLVLELVDRFDNEQQRAEVTFVYGYFANSWIRGLKDSEDVFRRAYESGVETGDFFHAGCASSATVQNMLMRGADLDSVLLEADRFAEFVTRVHTTESLGTIRVAQQTVKNLDGLTSGIDTFSDGSFDEAAFAATLPEFGSAHLAHYYFVDKLLTQLLWEQFDEAAVTRRASAGYLKESPGMQHGAEHHFLSGMLDARLADGASRAGKYRYERSIRKAVRLHRKWAADSPETFLHKQYLLQAELERVTGHDLRALRYYDMAIAAAERQGYQHLLALAHELAGRTYLRIGMQDTARYHLATAAERYQQWGARALASELSRRYSSVIGGLVLAERSDQRHISTETSGESLDLETVMKSSQALAGEIQFSTLLPKLMTIARENAGAQRGVLLRAQGGGFTVQAEITSDGNVLLPGEREAAQDGWARSVVNYVARSGEPVVLVDAVNEGQFRDDPYIVSAASRSVLCTPLYYLGELFGLLYLENNLTSGAFTEERIDMLTLLSGQISISIANAELYEQLEAKVRERTAQLEARNQLIRQTFGRYLSDEIVDDLLRAPEGTALSGEKRQVTVIVSDLRGFTPLAEALRPEDVVSLINNYLSAMTDVINSHDGTIIDFVGDSVIAVFGAPFTHDDDAVRAIACAIDMQRAMAAVNETNALAGYPEIGMGVALDTGEVVVGSIGSEKRAKYTVLGSHVNLAARIETYTVQGDVLISPNTRAAAGGVLDIGAEIEIHPKGVAEPILVSYVQGIRGPHAIQLPGDAEALVDVQPPCSVSYADIDGKHVGDLEHTGLIHRLSSSAAEVEASWIPEALSNLKVVFGADRDGERVAYAKVAPGPSGSNRFTVTFTSISDDCRTEIDRILTEHSGRSGAS